MTEPTDLPDDASQCIAMNRYNLRRFFGDFQVSVALFELLERGGGPPSVGVFGGIFIQYRIVAARDGGLNVYHFRCSLEAIKKQMPLAATLAKKVDPIAIRKAVTEFDRLFPNTDHVRHGIAHAGEVFKNPAAMKVHQQKQPHEGAGFAIGSGGWFQEALYER